MRESKIESDFAKWVRGQGGLFLKLALLGMMGFPDRTILMPGGRVFFLEFKTPTGRVSPQQDYWIERLRALGFVAEVVRSLDEAVSIVEQLSTDTGRQRRK